jgi:hypothetical protein
MINFLYLFDNILFFIGHKNVQVRSRFGRNHTVISLSPGSGFGSVYQDFSGSAELDPIEIFTDPQHDCK